MSEKNGTSTRRYPRLPKGEIARLTRAVEEYGVEAVCRATGVSSSRIYDVVAQGQQRSTGFRVSTIAAIVNGLNGLAPSGGVHGEATTPYAIVFDLTMGELSSLLQAADADGASVKAFLTKTIRDAIAEFHALTASARSS